jgi:hypothetical protein
MKPVATKVLILKEDISIEKNFWQSGPEKEKNGDYKEDCPEDFSEAIKILGLDHGTLKFSKDYDWMVETTKQILEKHGIAYFRKDILKLMKAWDAFGKI